MAGLSRIHQQAVHQLLREQTRRVAYGRVWQAIARHFEVGSLQGNWLHFDAPQRRALRELATLEWGFDPLVGVPDGSRLEVAALAIDEKTARQRPDDAHVLIKGRLPFPLPSLAAELSLRVPLQSLALDAIEDLLVIENLDSFDHWQQYQAPPQVTNALLLYRGHGGWARGARRLLEALPASVRVTLFGDYDPAGLAIAVDLPRVDAVLAPPLSDALLAKSSRSHFERQYRSASHLESVELGGWQPLWDEIKARRASIKQQHMLALQTPLRWLAR